MPTPPDMGREAGCEEWEEKESNFLVGRGRETGEEGGDGDLILKKFPKREGAAVEREAPRPDAGWGSGSCCPSRTVTYPLSKAPAALPHHHLILNTQEGRRLHLGPADSEERGGGGRPPVSLSPSSRTHQEHRAAHYFRHALPQLGRGARLT